MSDALHAIEQLIAGKHFPVLQQTLDLLERQDDPVETTADMALVVGSDPGLTISLLRKANTTPHEHLNHRLTNIEYAIMMYGMNRVRQLARTLPVLEKVAKPEALLQVRYAIGRALLTASMSVEWARMHRDMVPGEVYLAALLHNMGEIALWLYAPAEAGRVQDLVNSGEMGQDEAYYLTLGYTQEALAMSLARRWNMPALMQDALNAANSLHPRVMGILLSHKLSRLRQCGWESAEAMECLDQLAQHINRPPAEVHALVLELTRRWELLFHHSGFVQEVGEGVVCPVPGRHGGATSSICLAPQPRLYQEMANRLNHPESVGLNVEEVLMHVVEGMHDGLGLNRVVFAHLVPELGVLHAHYVVGGEDDPVFAKFNIELARHGLFRWMMTTPKALWINELNRRNVAALLPEEFSHMVGVGTFFAQSVFVNGKPFGVFYADREAPDCELDSLSYKRFQVLATLATKYIEYYRSHHRG